MCHVGFAPTVFYNLLVIDGCSKYTYEPLTLNHFIKWWSGLWQAQQFLWWHNNQLKDIFIIQSTYECGWESCLLLHSLHSSTILVVNNCNDKSIIVTSVKSAVTSMLKKTSLSINYFTQFLQTLTIPLLDYGQHIHTHIHPHIHTYRTCTNGTIPSIVYCLSTNKNNTCTCVQRACMQGGILTSNTIITNENTALVESSNRLPD